MMRYIACYLASNNFLFLEENRDLNINIKAKLRTIFSDISFKMKTIFSLTKDRISPFKIPKIKIIGTRLSFSI